MTVYNDCEFLEEAIRSILSQTYKNLQLMIINDGSTEKQVARLIKSIDDSRIIYKELSKNEGLAFSLNYGIEQILQMPDVKYIARMDADDISLPFRIESQVNYLEVNESVDILGGAAFVFGEKKEQKIVCYPS